MNKQLLKKPDDASEVGGPSVWGGNPYVMDQKNVDRAIEQIHALAKDSVTSIDDLLSAVNASYVFADFEDKDDGEAGNVLAFCKVVQDGKSEIVIRDGLSEEEQCFALFHELGHILMHKDALAPEYADNRVSTARRGINSDMFAIDLEASEFARRILVNKTELEKLASTISLGELAKHFCLPVDHLIKAAVDYEVSLSN